MISTASPDFPLARNEEKSNLETWSGRDIEINDHRVDVVSEDDEFEFDLDCDKLGDDIPRCAEAKQRPVMAIQ